MVSIRCAQGQAEGIREHLVLVPISEGIPQDVQENFGVQESQEGLQDLHLSADWEQSTPLFVRATVPQLIRYTCGPGRSLDYCMSQRHRDQREHEPKPTAGKFAPKGGSPKESPHNQHLRLKRKGRYIDKRRDI